jgi:hypothetical protein
VQIDSTYHRHGDTQQMVIRDDDESLVVPLELSNCMIHFKHRLPNDQEVKSLKQYCLTRGDSTWNPLAFSDQVVNMNHRKALDEKKKKAKTNLKSKNEIDCLRQVHELDMAEKIKDISLKRCKILKSCEDRGEDDNTFHDCYMVWYDIIKTRSWMDAYVFSLGCSVLNTSIKTFCITCHLVISLIIVRQGQKLRNQR